MIRGRYKKLTPELIAEAKKLIDSGMTAYAAARKLHTRVSSVYHHTNPEYRKRNAKARKLWASRPENREKIRKANRDRLRKIRLTPEGRNRMRLYSHRWRLKNKKKADRDSAKWRKAHPERMKFLRKRWEARQKLNRLRHKALVEYYRKIIESKRNENLPNH